MAHLRTAVVALVAVGALAACGFETGDGPAVLPLPTGSGTFDVADPVWVEGATAHVGDRSFALDPAPEAFVVGASGLYYLAHGVLYFADDQGTRQVDEVGDQSQLRASADGRYLGYVDYGPELGVRVAEAVVYDTTTGERLNHSTEGNGSEGGDLSDLYAESASRFLGFDESAGYVAASSNDVYRLPLDGGDPEKVGYVGDPAGSWPVAAAGGDRVWVRADGGQFRIPDDGDGTTDGGSLSPSGKFASANSWGPTVFFDVALGEEVVVRSGFRHVLLGRWVDGEEFLGVGFDGRFPDGLTGRSAVLRCSLRTRECDTLAAVTDAGKRGVVLFAAGEAASVV